MLTFVIDLLSIRTLPKKGFSLFYKAITTKWFPRITVKQLQSWMLRAFWVKRPDTWQAIEALLLIDTNKVTHAAQGSNPIYDHFQGIYAVAVAVQHWHLACPQLHANTAWNESLHNSLRKRVSLALPCWKLARTISYRPFCTASAICCMLSIVLNLIEMIEHLSVNNYW